MSFKFRLSGIILWNQFHPFHLTSFVFLVLLLFRLAFRPNRINCKEWLWKRLDNRKEPRGPQNEKNGKINCEKHEKYARRLADKEWNTKTKIACREKRWIKMINFIYSFYIFVVKSYYSYLIIEQIFKFILQFCYSFIINK